MHDKMEQTLQNMIDVFLEAPGRQTSLREVLEIIKDSLHGDITIYMKERGKLSRTASTLDDEDEIRFLDRQVLATTDISDIVRLERRRKGISDACLFQISCGEIEGKLLYEKKEKTADGDFRDYALVFQILKLCLTVYIQHRDMRRNLYLDPLTGLPGQKYFLMSIEKWKNYGRSQWILAVRIVDYAGQIQLLGTERWNQIVVEVAEILQSGCRTYRIGIDTLAAVLADNKMDASEQMIKFSENLRGKYDVKMVMLDVFLYDDLLAVLEKEFPNCRQGKVLIPSQEDADIFDIFKEKSKKAYRKPALMVKESDDEEMALFDLM